MTATRPTRTRALAGLGAAGVLSGTSLLGLGLINAGHADAATTLVYTCSTAVGDKDVTVDLDTNAPATVTVGQSASVTSVSGQIHLDGSLGNAMAGFLGWHWVAGTTPADSVLTAPDGKTVTVSTTLGTTKTQIYDTTWVNDGTYGGFAPDGHLVLPLSASVSGTFTPTATGDYTVSAPDTFTSSFTGTKADGSTATMAVPCTYKSGDKVIDTVVVTAATSSTITAPSSSTTSPSPSDSSTTSTTPTMTPTSSGPASSTSTPVPTGTTPSTVQTGSTGDDGSMSAAVAAGAALVAAGGASLAGAALTRRRK